MIMFRKITRYISSLFFAVSILLGLSALPAGALSPSGIPSVGSSVQTLTGGPFFGGIASDPAGNLYFMDTQCTIYKLSAGSSAAPTPLGTTGGNWCNQEYSSLLYAVLNGVEMLIVTEYNLTSIYEYSLATDTLVSVGGPAEVITTFYDPTIDTLFFGIAWRPAGPSTVQQINNFSACSAATPCTATNFPVALPTRGPEAIGVANGRLYVSPYQSTSMYSIALSGESSWTELPLPATSACAQDAGYFALGYFDQMVVTPGGDLYVTCQAKSELFAVLSGSTAVESLDVTGTAVSYPYGLVLMNGALYTAQDNGTLGKFTIPPSTPWNIVVTPSDHSVLVTWTASPGATSYTVTALPGGAQCTTTSATSCTISGLSNGSEYTFTVTATGANGSSGSSAPASITVGALPATGTNTALMLELATVLMLLGCLTLALGRRRSSNRGH